MIKIIDTDKLFQQFATEYVKKNAVNLTAEEIEENIELIFTAFANTTFSELDGLSPVKYYDSFSADELALALIEHLNSGIAPSAYLCESLAEKEGGEEIIAGLLNENDEEKISYAINLLNDKGSKNYLDKYLDFILNSTYSSVVELSTEALISNAEMVKERVLNAYGIAKLDRKINLVEILSYVKDDERAFKILIDEFNANPDKMMIYASYLSRYGDERAIEVLTLAISSDKIDYADYQELKCAIESLGGEVDIKKDFSKDKAFLSVKNFKIEN
ncbi:MAG: hypothetical protein J6V68_03745 [Clostridia bacterium]|nr:hypothetical protein [Clostridia bacterium]